MFGFTPDPLGIDNVRSVHGRSGVDQVIVPAGHRVLLMDADDAVFTSKRPICAACLWCKPSRVNFSVSAAGTVGEVQVVAMS